MWTGPRAREQWAALAATLEPTPVLPLELTDPRYHHIALTFCPLDDGRAMVVPETSEGWRQVADLVPEPLVLAPNEAAAFCANSVVVGRTVVMPACPPRVGRILESWGFEVAVADVTEFLKAGGACRCLTLPLDVNLTASIPEGAEVMDAGAVRAGV